MNVLTALVLLLTLVACDRQPTEMPASADLPALQGKIYKYGLYRQVRKGRITDEPAANTGKTARNLVVEHVEQSDRIALVKGSYFGYRYRLFNLPAALQKQAVMELRRVLIHPEMILPDGSRTRGSERTVRERIKTGQVLAHFIYGFHEDYEMVEGAWTLQIWHRDRLLVEQTFTTFRPASD